MNAVSATIFGGGRVIHQKQDELKNQINYSVILLLLIYINPRLRALGQPLWMPSHASD